MIVVVAAAFVGKIGEKLVCVVSIFDILNNEDCVSAIYPYLEIIPHGWIRILFNFQRKRVSHR